MQRRAIISSSQKYMSSTKLSRDSVHIVICQGILFISQQINLDKPARLIIRFVFGFCLIVRRVPRRSESGCKKSIGLKKYLLGF